MLFNYIYTRTSGAYGPLVLALVEGLGAVRAPCQGGCNFVFLYFFVVFLSFCTVQYSNRRGGWCQGVAHFIFHSMCGVSVTGAASLVAECGTNILFQKTQKITFLKHLFGALPKIGDWIQKYVQICHGFPFLKWCETSQLVQRFGCKRSLKWVFQRRSRTLQF